MNAQAETSDQRPRPQRPALHIFAQTTLLLESIVTFFAALVAWGLARSGSIDMSPLTVWVGGIGLAAAFAFASARATARWGRVLGWILHVPFIAAGWVLPAAAFMGVVFAAVYGLGVRWGSRIDRERAERALAEGGDA